MELHLAKSVSVANGEEFCKKVPFLEQSRLARDVGSKWMSSTLHFQALRNHVTQKSCDQTQTSQA